MSRRKIALSLFFVLGILPALAGGMLSAYKMSKGALLNKVEGGWAGRQTMGVAYGGPTEFKYTDISLRKAYGTSYDQALQIIGRFDVNMRLDTVKFLNPHDSVKTDSWSMLAHKHKKTGTEVFTTARDAEVPYRIPAIAQTRAGDLIYFTDYRPCKQDIGFGRVDQHYRISRDGGKTWGAEQVLVEGTGTKGAMDCAYGDPVIAADRESDELYLSTGCGDRPYPAATTTRQNPFPMVDWRSKDGGKTWSRPREITEKIYRLLDKGSLGPAQSLFFSSGKMTQSRMVKKDRYYRLYVAILVRGQGNYLLYSDDFGNGWKILGGNQVQPCLEGDEAKCEELPDGSVLLSSRKNGGRFFNVFNYTDVRKGRGVWQQCAASQDDNHGCRATDNSTNGEILSVKAVRQEDQKELTLLLQSVPLGPGRSHVGIWYKALESKADYSSPAVIARNWEDFFQVTALNSAYSTMVQLHDGSIAFAWEEARPTPKCSAGSPWRKLPVENIDHAHPAEMGNMETGYRPWAADTPCV